jgi:hypothetical protein
MLIRRLGYQSILVSLKLTCGGSVEVSNWCRSCELIIFSNLRITYAYDLHHFILFLCLELSESLHWGLFNFLPIVSIPLLNIEQYVTLWFCRILNAFSKVPPKPKISSAQRYLRYCGNQLDTTQNWGCFDLVLDLSRTCTSKQVLIVFILNNWMLKSSNRYSEKLKVNQDMHSVTLLDGTYFLFGHHRLRNNYILQLYNICEIMQVIMVTRLVPTFSC